ncbi:hypothetical protein [Nostoc sp.]|uniref:hypothetical protein n=1 Tax=Nostoc sp. TaxID=1180 RepID=UPI002FF9F1C5
MELRPFCSVIGVRNLELQPFCSVIGVRNLKHRVQNCVGVARRRHRISFLPSDRSF